MPMAHDEHTAPPHELDVVVTLQDGRVLDGWMHRYELVLECERVLFEPWQVDEVFPQ
jgi:hypothetical protein